MSSRRRFFFGTINSQPTLVTKLLGEFDVADNASISDGTTLDATHGVTVGEMTVDRVDGTFSIANQRLQIAAQTSPVWDDMDLDSPRYFELMGEELSFSIYRTSGTVQIGLVLTDKKNNVPFSMIAGLELNDDNTLYTIFLGTQTSQGTMSVTEEYEFKIILGGYSQDGGIAGNKIYGYYIFIRGGDYTNWHMLYKGWAKFHIPTTAIGTDETIEWEDFSDGTNALSISGGVIKMLDNSSGLGNQTKLRTLAYPIGDNMLIKYTLEILQLNNTSQFDSDGDGYAYIDAAETGDDFLSEVGQSFAIVHERYDVRAQMWLQKAMDYATTGDLELWCVQNAADLSGNFEFVRLYKGNAFALNEIFTLEIEYRLDDSNTFYNVLMRKDGLFLIYEGAVGMISNTGGNGSIVLQCKGTATNPVETKIHGIKVYYIPKHKFLINNYTGAATLDHIRIGAKTLTVVSDYSSDSVDISTTFTHSLNCLIQLHVLEYSGTDFLRFAFRYQDANNYYFVNVSSAGVITLNSKVAGADTVLVTSTISAKDDTKLMVKVYNNTARIYLDNFLGGTYATLSSFAASDDFNFIQIPVDCSIKNIVCEQTEINLEDGESFIQYIETVATPADNGSNATAPIAVNIPAGAITGDLIAITVVAGTAAATISVSNAANQTWTLGASFSNTARVYYCKFNGNWAGATQITFASSYSAKTSAILHVFRPVNPASTWAVDGTPFTGTTPASTNHQIQNTYTTAHRSVTLAIWYVGGARTYGSLIGSRWNQIGSQYRNTADTDFTLAFCYKVANKQIATGAVRLLCSNAQAAAIAKITFSET